MPDDALPKARGGSSPASLLLGLKVLKLIRCDLNRHLYAGSFLSQPVPPVFFLPQDAAYEPIRDYAPLMQPSLEDKSKDVPFPKSLPHFQPQQLSVHSLCTVVPTRNFLVGAPSVDDPAGMSQLFCLTTAVAVSYTHLTLPTKA